VVVVKKVIVKRITVIKFGVNGGGGNGTGCCGIEVRADAAKLMNTIISGFRERFGQKRLC